MTVRRITRRWIAPTGGRSSEGDDFWVTHPTWTRKCEEKAAWWESVDRREGVEDAAAQGPRDMAKAQLFVAQSPEMEIHILRHDAWSRSHRHQMVLSFAIPTLPAGGRWAMSSLKGTDWAAYVTLDTSSAKGNAGSPTGREPHGDGVSVVVVGATSHQGGRESRPQGEGTQVSRSSTGEVCVMQSADAVLEIIRERGRKGLPLQRLYRCLFNPGLYLRAYAKISKNAGSLTPGVTAETVDGKTLSKIDAIIDALRHECYRWSPARRVYIAKKEASRKRPLGLPSWSDKLLQEVVRQLLEAYYEPQFFEHSHGFRPGRGCHTALGDIYPGWRGTVWFIEGDVRQCLASSTHYPCCSLRSSKRVALEPGGGFGSSIRRPLRRPERRCRARSSSRFTRCNTVCLETPSAFIASHIVTHPRVPLRRTAT